MLSTARSYRRSQLATPETHRFLNTMVHLIGKFTPLILILQAFITACSSPQPAQQSAAASSPSLATVYFYRLHNSPGGAVGVDLTDNGIDIGTLQDGTYFVYHANPGVRSFTAATDTTATQNFTLPPGATYYIKARVVPSQHLFQPSLGVVFHLQGEAAIQNLKRLHYHR